MKFFKDKRTKLRELRLKNCNKVLNFMESYIGKEVTLFDRCGNPTYAVIESIDLINNDVIVNDIDTFCNEISKHTIFSVSWDTYNNRNIKIKVRKHYGIKFELRFIIQAKGSADREFLRIEEDM